MYVRACVRACARVCVRACVRACVYIYIYICVCEQMRECVCASVHTHDVRVALHA